MRSRTNLPVETTRLDCRRDLPIGFASRPDQPPFHFENGFRPSSMFLLERASRQPEALFDSIHLALAAGHRASLANPTRLGRLEPVLGCLQRLARRQVNAAGPTLDQAASCRN